MLVLDSRVFPTISVWNRCMHAQGYDFAFRCQSIFFSSSSRRKWDLSAVFLMGNKTNTGYGGSDKE